MPDPRTDVEFDLGAVPDAEAVHVVNNKAAMLLVLAHGKEIVLSRGELVEIADGFRIPGLLAANGTRLREVVAGCT